MATKQAQIPGTEVPTITEVNVAAEAYVEARDARMAKTPAEVSAKETLIEVMKKHSLTTYRDDDATPPLIVTLKPGKDKVRVEPAESDEDEDGAEGED